MNRHEMMTAYGALAEPRRVSFLARLSWELTVLARDTYAVGSDRVDQPARLRAFNECQHQVAQHLHQLLEGEAARYPEEVFGEILCESAAELGFEQRLSKLLAEVASGSAASGARAQATGRVA